MVSENSSEPDIGDKMSTYGWIITKDHLWNPEYDSPEDNETGTIGPSDITPELKALLNSGKGHTFYMRDDDRELYYTGKLVWDGEEPDEEALAGPLDDFGRPNAGAIMIDYHERPDWSIG